MDGLRWGLLVIGIVILAVIYWFARRKRARWDDRDLYATPDGGLISTLSSTSMTTKGDPENLEQELAELADVLSEDRRPSQHSQEPPRLVARERASNKPVRNPIPAHPAAAQHQEQYHVAAPAQLIVLHVLAPPSEYFHGPDILRAARASGLAFGDKHIFHRLSPDLGPHHPVFGLLNMVNPGSFDINNIDTLYTPGLALFMEIPTTGDDLAAYQDMVGTAQTLAGSLSGMVCDERRNPLTPHTISNTREQIRDVGRRSGAEQETGSDR